MAILIMSALRTKIGFTFGAYTVQPRSYSIHGSRVCQGRVFYDDLGRVEDGS